MTLRKYHIVILLLALSACARAVAGPALPVCVPGVRGYTVSHPVYEVTAGYQHVAWFCTDKDRATWLVAGWSCRTSACFSGTVGIAIREITRSTAPVTAARKHWDQWVKTDCEAPNPSGLNKDVCDARQAWIAQNRKVWKERVIEELAAEADSVAAK